MIPKIIKILNIYHSDLPGILNCFIVEKIFLIITKQAGKLKSFM
jgi:hypothetical protein